MVNLNIGVIGLGARLRVMLRYLRDANPDTLVTALADPDSDAATWLESVQGVRPRILDIETLVNSSRIDGVMIGTRDYQHAEQAVAVLRTGLPLFLEKPVVIDWDQWSMLDTSYAISSSPTVISFPLRRSAMITQVKELVGAGRIGEIQHLQAINNVPAYGIGAYYHGWMREEALTGGLWMQKATHDLDYLTYLIGEEPARVSADESKTKFVGSRPAGLRCVECDERLNCPEGPETWVAGGGKPTARFETWRCVFASDTGNHDSASAIIKYKSLVHASYTQNFYSRRQAATRGAIVTGTTGSIRFDWFRGVVTLTPHYDDAEERYTINGDEDGHFGGDLELARDFIAACRGDERPGSADLRDGLTSAAIALAARDSCATGARSRVPSPKSGGRT
ncbi:Gfo/Idh/MocA family oxidoreductase [Ruania alkalisoli]|uniref:Gfo/Idh/MocA family oxidoreductase n=1 Tax=Ruania alkalisoli TaxID=2779775 RepID=A0A7M1STB0_9MICO|nr:Gfo/Idh/MocA family oxidoreductase [Ruania alkalisoli]QOR70809.1 Gfo/Idh/MocA family oxidoreductase [Ruania alkalisoli]